MQFIESGLTVNELLSATDWWVFFLIIILTFTCIVYGHLRNSSPKKNANGLIDFLLMGRKLSLPLFVATLVATWYGGIFGVTAIAFDQGIYNLLTQGIFWYAAYIVFALFIAKKARANGPVTLPELVGNLFGPKSAKIAAWLNLINLLPMAYMISLGLLIESFTGMSYLQSMIVGVSVVTMYSVFGGMRTIVFSDLVQFIVMCLSVFLVLLYSFKYFGGFSQLQSSLPESYFQFTGKMGLAETLSWGLIAFATLVDPNFYHRCFSADSSRTAKVGIILATVVWFLFDICTTFGAMYAKSMMPNADSHSAYLFYGLQLLPEGARGFFLAGITATILSTLDSYLFLAATTFSIDLLPKKFRNIKTHHLSFISIAVLSLIFSQVFDGNIKLVWQTLGGLSASSLLIPLLLRYFTNIKISEKDFIFHFFISSLVYVLSTFLETAIMPIYLGISAGCLYFLLNSISKKTSRLISK